MVGNVSEWTQSLFQPYLYIAGDGQNDFRKAGARAHRGGSWFSPGILASVTSRGMNDPDFFDNDLDFRLPGLARVSPKQPLVVAQNQLVPHAAEITLPGELN